MCFLISRANRLNYIVESWAGLYLDLENFLKSRKPVKRFIGDECVYTPFLYLFVSNELAARYCDWAAWLTPWIHFTIWWNQRLVTPILCKNFLHVVILQMNTFFFSFFFFNTKDYTDEVLKSTSWLKIYSHYTEPYTKLFSQTTMKWAQFSFPSRYIRTHFKAFIILKHYKTSEQEMQSHSLLVVRRLDF